ncbi:hypothetical protein [Flavihumibacter fluvii]|uniref:hypothetical protein n=1 Tax=Flavihumibacter fluvii TaxID=2838157 RepID=UPI001BDE20B5|nr:hypothetical protein [Flavihumibacter fluvii]ULQ51071.1 hypothetical protein KJS93_13350 [Flavihumibacter fluvii]
MARITNNLLMTGAQGKVGKQMVYKEINGKSFVAQYPDMSQVQYNDAQKEYQKLFGQASTYASGVLKDPERCASYEKKIRNDKRLRGQSVYHTAHKAYMAKHSHKLSDVELQKIMQYYLDNFLLTEHQVTALAYLVAHQKLSNAIYQEINKVSKATATRHLQDMIGQGIISFQAKGAGAIYNLAHPFPRELQASEKQDTDLI